jgi:hypothetical protein
MPNTPVIAEKRQAGQTHLFFSSSAAPRNNASSDRAAREGALEWNTSPKPAPKERICHVKRFTGARNVGPAFDFALWPVHQMIRQKAARISQRLVLSLRKEDADGHMGK